MDAARVREGKPRMNVSRLVALVFLGLLLSLMTVSPGAAIDLTKAQPVLTTIAFPGATAGNPIQATAILNHATWDATGTITFALYGPDDILCSNATPAAAGTRTVNGDGGWFNSDVMTLSAPGTYRWVVAYSGDAKNDSALSPCNAPGGTSVITQSWAFIVTAATTTASVGGTIQDTAKTYFENGTGTGTITFTVYGPDDATCGGPATAAGSITGTFVDDGTYSSLPIVAALPGTYRWIASYSGDLTTKSATSVCNEPAGLSVVR
jgi:hypothetical protein